MNVTELTERYVAAWCEPDPERRETAVRQLWADDGVHLLQAPEDIRSSAGRIGFELGALEARGHRALLTRVTRSYEEFVAPGAFVFRSRGDAEQLHDMVKFHWEMAPAEGGPPAAVGLEILVLAPDGRIATDYQFIES